MRIILMIAILPFLLACTPQGQHDPEEYERVYKVFEKHTHNALKELGIPTPTPYVVVATPTPTPTPTPEVAPVEPVGEFTQFGVVLPNGPNGSPDAWGLSEPDIAAVNGGYQVYYECLGEYGDEMVWRLCMATSEGSLAQWSEPILIDGITSTVGPEPAIVAPDESPDGLWHLYWTIAPTGNVRRAEIGHATSQDGLNWNAVGKAIPFSQIDQHGLFKSWSEPNVIKRGPGDYILYAQVYDSASMSYIAYATSSDLFSWTLNGVVIQSNLGVAGPAVKRWNGTYYMFYNSVGINLATSSDGISWERWGTDALIKPQPGTWNQAAVYEPGWIVTENGDAFVLFGGYENWNGQYDGDTNLQIGLAVGRLP